MEIRLASLIGAATTVGTTVIILVFRVFTTAAVALSRSARRIMMVDSLVLRCTQMIHCFQSRPKRTAVSTRSADESCICS